MKPIHRFLQRTHTAGVIDRLLALRALFFLGSRWACPCCGWNLRTFTHGGASLRPRVKGYCPRCNAKARHRWSWLFLQQQTDLFEKSLRLLHISPAYSLSRRLRALPNLQYLAGDIVSRIDTHVVFDLAQTPFPADMFDAIISIHVLEHVAHDREAISEIFRVLRPGGWAVISVPIRLNEATFEDPTITSSEARKEAFGEKTHMRLYGADFEDRLREPGFAVEIHKAADLEDDIMEKYGLRDDEVIFFCKKP